MLLVLIDDAGFASNSVFGGVVPTPTVEKLAQRGLRYTEMHNTALCSPTRAALLTGRNHHVVGYGMVAEMATGYPGYDTITGPEDEHGAMTLKQNGYATAWFGKNHNVPIWTAAPTGPFDQFPVGHGYEYFYGFVGGDTSQWEPGSLYRNTTPIHPYDGQLSMGYTWDKANANAPSTRKTQYFEIFGNRAIYHDGWMAVTNPVTTPWEGVKGNPTTDVMNGFRWSLYNLNDDPTEVNDLAAKEPERLLTMQQLWIMEATANNVFPLNDSQLPTLTVERPGPAAGRTKFEYFVPQDATQFGVAPGIINRSYTITADIEVPQGSKNLLQISW